MLVAEFKDNADIRVLDYTAHGYCMQEIEASSIELLQTALSSLSAGSPSSGSTR